MLAKLLFTFILLSTLQAQGMECVKDPKFYFSNDGTKRYGKITISNHYKDGECNLRISMTRVTKSGRKIEEQFTFSDQGKLTTFIGSGSSFNSSTNSRATGSRAYYLLPRKKDNVSYDMTPQGKLIVHMANGEKATFDPNRGELQDISNTKWKRNKALRSYVKDGKIVAEDVFAENCMNCSLKYKVPYDKFIYSQGDLIIEDVDNGVVMSTPFVRGKDSRLPTQWGNQIKGTFQDNQGNKCSISNKFLYDYEYEQFGSRRSIDKIHFKFPTDLAKSKTRVGEENIQQFLKRVCIKQKGVKDFNLDFYDAAATCENCKNTVQDALPETTSIKKLFDAIDTNLTDTSSTRPSDDQNSTDNVDDSMVQKGAFESKDNAKELYRQEIEKGNKCEIRVIKPYYKVFCIN